LRRDINWFGLAGGAAIICLIFVSFFVPWWQLVVGDGLVTANVSPLYTDFNFVGYWFTIPLLWALNLGSVLSMAAGGVAMLIYSIYPGKSYSKNLLGFGYKKPLISVLIFVIILVVLTQTIQAVFNLTVPLVGSATSVLPETMTYGTIVRVLITANFQWPFYLAVVAAGVCIVGRFYHKKLLLPSAPAPSPVPAAPVASPPAVGGSQAGKQE
jgi:hypothetical protein